MPQFDRVETRIVDVPAIRSHVLSVATLSTMTFVIVTVGCTDGSQGRGEAISIGGLSYSDESPEGIQLAIDRYIAPLLIGRDIDHLGKILTDIDAAIVGNRFARNAVETALLDRKGRVVELPISDLLGHRRRDQLEVAWTLASGDTSADIEEAQRMLETRRHRIFKLKVGKRPVADDIAHIVSIHNALNGAARLRIDVNQAWSGPQATHALEALAGIVELAEQPLRVSERHGMARLTARGRVPIMADEALQGVENAFGIAAAHEADVFAIKTSQAGGPYGASRVAGIAAAAGLGIYGGTMLESGFGTAASAQVFSTFPTLAWGTELFGPLLLVEELLEKPLHYHDFMLDVPTGPGVGVDYAWQDVERLTRAGSITEYRDRS